MLAWTCREALLPSMDQYGYMGGSEVERSVEQESLGLLFFFFFKINSVRVSSAVTKEVSSSLSCPAR